MNLFDLPDDGRRSLDALRRRVERLENELKALISLGPLTDVSAQAIRTTKSELQEAEKALIKAEEEAAK